MPEPVTLAALGVALGKVLLRWGDLNDSAEGLEDVRAGFGALRALTAKGAKDPVAAALAGLHEQRMIGVHVLGRRQEDHDRGRQRR